MKLVLTIALISFLAYRSSADPVMLFCTCYALVLAVCIVCKRIDDRGLFRGSYLHSGSADTSNRD